MLPNYEKGIENMDINRIQAAYAALGENTPLKEDCGRLCGAACCQTDEDGQGGVELLPGEEALLKGIDWGEIKDGLLQCNAPCEREKRPLMCRNIPPWSGAQREGSGQVDAAAGCPRPGGLPPEPGGTEGAGKRILPGRNARHQYHRRGSGGRGLSGKLCRRGGGIPEGVFSY